MSSVFPASALKPSEQKQAVRFGRANRRDRQSGEQKIWTLIGKSRCPSLLDWRVAVNVNVRALFKSIPRPSGGAKGLWSTNALAKPPPGRLNEPEYIVMPEASAK